MSGYLTAAQRNKSRESGCQLKQINQVSSPLSSLAEAGQEIHYRCKRFANSVMIVINPLKMNGLIRYYE
jgi:hypothetical protein